MVNGMRPLAGAHGECSRQRQVDGLSTLPRANVREALGHLDDPRMKAVDRALLRVVGVV